MDASALARALDNLEKSWSLLDCWLNFWTILVVVGVATELIVIITEYAHDRRDFKRGTIRSPDKPSILIFGLETIGAALVVIGVAGEFQVHVRAGRIETDMRDLTRQSVAISNRDAAASNEHAAVADQKAGEANERAGKNEREAAGLRKDADILRGKNLALEGEVLRLQERLAWRRISAAQHDEFVALLKPYAGSPVFINGFDNADIESKTFAEDIFRALHDALWNVSLNLTNTASNLPVGVFCRIDVRTPAGTALSAILKKLPGVKIIAGQFADSIGVITVGLRPPP